METKTETKTAKLKVVKIEETQFWSKKIIKKAGKLFGVYIFDENESTFLCEITPSHYLRFLYTFAERFDEQTEELIRESDTTEGGDFYMHAGDANKIKSEATYEFEYEGEIDGDDYQEKMEELLGAWTYILAGNPPVC